MRTARLVLLLVAIAGLLVLAASGGGPRVARAVPLGSNGKIAFIRDNDVWTINPDGSDETQVTSDAGPGTANLWPAWSPSGTQIAYTHDAGGQVNIWIVDADGGDPHQLTSGGHDDLPDWSPDGHEIVFEKSQAGTTTPFTDVWQIGTDGSNLTNLTNGQGSDAGRYPSYSPDGNRIVYSVGRSDNSGGDLYTLASNGSDKTRILQGGHGQFPAYASWSPDGTTILYLVAFAGGSTTQDTYAVNASGGTPHLVATNIQEAKWSPDGRQIVAYSPGDGIVVMDADGSNGRTLTTGSYPSWGPAPRSPVAVEFTQATQELQTVDQLQTSLAANGQPPVPIVAGKDAALRVYFEDVQQQTDYDVDVSGLFSGQEHVSLDAGCAIAQQRGQQNGCRSVDFYFTPPHGVWHERIEVKDFAGTTVFDQDFQLASVDTAPLTIKYIPTCVALTAGAQPTCPGGTVSNADGFLKKIFPVTETGLSYSPLAVPPLVYGAPIAPTQLLADLYQEYALTTQGGFVEDQLVGWVPLCGATFSPTDCRAGWSDPLWASGTGVVSWEVDTDNIDPDGQLALAHEIAHNLGLRHTSLSDGCGAVDSQTDWPEPDSTIQEVGFDVTANPPAPIPASKKDLMSYCWTPAGNLWISPFDYNKLLNGNLSPQSDEVAHPAGGAAVPQLVIKGSAQANGSAATIDSAYVITSTIPPDPPNPIGNYCLHLSGGAQLDWCFEMTFKDHQSQQPVDSESFALRVPFPDGTTHVGLMLGAQELATLDASASAPGVTITQPDHSWSGEETLAWTGSDADGDPLKYAVMYSPDNGTTWLPIDVDDTGESFSFDTSVLEGDHVLVRVLASDGLNTTIATSDPITVNHGTPRLWGDDNCDGSITLGDGIGVARDLVGLSVSQTADCPGVGAAVTADGTARTWGDVDCSGTISLGDSIGLARFLVGIVPSIAGCPVIGSTVNVQG